jgi:hypothetical protein
MNPMNKAPGLDLAQDDFNTILTVRQAPQELKVSSSHMLRLLKGEVTGMPPVHHVRAGRSVRVRRGALAVWIRNVEQQRSGEPSRRS